MLFRSAQVFFVRGAAHNAVLVPMAALQTGTGAARNGGRRGGGGGGGGGGRRGGGRRGGNAVAGADENGPQQQRQASLTVIKEDGTQEVRNVVVGVSDRINAEIVSGLEEGDKVVAGSNQNAPGARGRGGRALGQPANGRGLGGFR